MMAKRKQDKRMEQANLGDAPGMPEAWNVSGVSDGQEVFGMPQRESVPVMGETQGKPVPVMGELPGDVLAMRGLSGEAVPTGGEVPVLETDGGLPVMESVPVLDVIGVSEIQEATRVLEEYKRGKANLEKRIIENEQWWKMRHWELFRNQAKDQLEPASAWLFNSVANKHADAMDNYPAPNVLPRAVDDEETARCLSSVLPVVLEQNEYEQVYSDTWWYKLKQGTGVKGVFWNPSKNNGLGDIDIRKLDILTLFWEPGITNIQDSRNLFHVELRDNDLLKEEYPEYDFSASPTINVGQYIYDDAVDTSKKSAVIDWYYKKTVDGVTRLHYCKFVNDHVLYASENDLDYRDRGFYDHGKYPVVFDTLFPEEGTPAGFGYIDVMKSCQMYIDKLNQAIMENALVSSRKRYFVRQDGSVNEEEFSDITKPLIHCEGNLGEDSIKELDYRPLSGIYYNILQQKIDELKETSGNRDFSQGSTANGVTAASAIAALQEAGSKLSRDMLKSTYRAYTQECYLVIELMRQFYDEPRIFRITGEQAGHDFVAFDNSGLLPQPQGRAFGLDLGSRLPVFDIRVSPEKRSTYSRLAQNELALQFYGQGFFNPQLTDQALACLDMMDFDGKEKVVDKIQRNGTLFQQVQQLQQQMMEMAAIIDSQNGTTIGQGMGNVFAGGEQAQPSGAMPAESRSTMMDRAREAAATQSAPR